MIKTQDRETYDFIFDQALSLSREQMIFETSVASLLFLVINEWEKSPTGRGPSLALLSAAYDVAREWEKVTDAEKLFQQTDLSIFDELFGEKDGGKDEG